MPEEFLTISELNRYIKDVLNAGFPQVLWICGEMQGFDRNKTKNHIFFELVEKDPNSKDIIARIGLVIFANRKTVIDSILKQSENAFELKDDIEVKLACKVDFYAPHGVVRLIVESIDPIYTLGKLAQERQKLIALLKDKGILDKNKQLSLPLVPLRIGLITSDDSAAYNDFISELKNSTLGFKVYLRNTIMQGKKTEKDVCAAIDELLEIPSLDVIVITRGGGSLSDLSCFDSQMIAEKIAACPLPVLSGIGHEINTTITDLAAHTYAKTPTAIAQFVVGIVQQFLQQMDDQFLRIKELADHQISEGKERTKNAALDLQSFTTQFFQDQNEILVRFIESLKYKPMDRLKGLSKDIHLQGNTLKQTIKSRFEKDQLKIKSYTKMIDIVNPVHTMKRGFTITRTKEGRLVRSPKDVSKTEGIVTEVFGGRIESVVSEIKNIS
jgi:exodeoxyribonuclease VII large subunit